MEGQAEASRRAGGGAAAEPGSRGIASSFLEVSPVSIRDVDARVEVELANGRRSRVPSTFDTTVMQKPDRRAGDDDVIPGDVRVFLCVEPIDMQLGCDRLA